MSFRSIGCIALSLLACGIASAGGTPQGSSFAYQGVFKQGGVPANGTFHLRFQLLDAHIGGAQVGGDFDAPGLAVVDGLFTVDLDFGPLAFDGSARWLQVQVVTNGGSTVTTLAPRQLIAASPYALFARAADGPNLTNLNASNLASGTVPSPQLGGTYSNALALTNASNTIAGTFAGSGAGVTNLNAANIDSGNLSTARLPTGGVWTLSGTLNLDSNTLVVDSVNNRVGIGTASPAMPLHVRDPEFAVMILQDSGPVAEQSGYLGFWNSVGAETGWVGYGTPGSPHMSVVNARSGGHIFLLPASNGSVGIGTTAPSSGNKVQVEGTASSFTSAIYAVNTVGNHGVIGQCGDGIGVLGIGDTGVSGQGSSIDGSGVKGTGDIGVEGSGNTGVEGTGFVGVQGSGSTFDFLAVGSGTNYGSTSSIRWKRNIEPIADPLGMLGQLRGVYYDWDAEHGGRHDVGMIAEEVGKVLPEIVAYEANGIDAVGMDYSKLTPLLVEAVNALRAEKDAEIARLNARIDELDQFVRDALPGRFP